MYHCTTEADWQGTPTDLRRRGGARRARDAPAPLGRRRRDRRAPGSLREEAWARAGAAKSLAALGDPAGARRALGRALAAWRRIADRRALAWHLLEAARLDREIGEGERAARELDEAVALATAIELPYLSEILSERSEQAAAAGAPAAALGDAARAVAAARAAGNDEMLWRAAIGLAARAAAAGERDRARRAIADALAARERRRGVAPEDEQGRIAAVDRTRRAEETAIRLLFDLGRGEEALLVAETARARSLLDRRAGHPAASLPESGAAARRHGVAILLAFTGEERLYLWAITPDGAIAARRSSIGSGQLGALVARASSPTSDAESSTRAWRALADAVWAPVAPRFAGLDLPIAIAADGALQRLPFGALPVAGGATLLDGRALFGVPSIGYLASREPDPAPAGRGVLLLADPEPPPLPGRDLPLPRLPGARAEARAVAALFAGEEATLLLDEDASEEQLARRAGGARIVHLAAHGLVDEARPLASRLALAATPAADGLWSAREALERPLAAELVVLSACGGGAGPDAGEGALGFGQALLGAGARSVIASLWPVADEVAAYEMERLYRHLGSGGDRAAALRAAALDTRAELARGRFRTSAGTPLAPDPRLWAAFVLLGDPR